MCARQGVCEVLAMSDLAKLKLGIGLGDGVECLLNCSVDRVEIYDAVLLLVYQVAQNCVNT